MVSKKKRYAVSPGEAARMELLAQKFNNELY